MVNSFTPQNNMGLGLPNGKVAFNLPRYQMPGTNVKFGGGFNLGADMTPNGSMAGMAPNANIGNVRFSLNRQTSSDQTQNIINDIQNPLGGVSVGFEQGTATPAPTPPPQEPAQKGPYQPNLRELMMMSQEAQGGPLNPYAKAMQLQNTFGVAGTNRGQPSSFQNDGTYGSIAAGLRNRMTGYNPAQGHVFL